MAGPTNDDRASRGAQAETQRLWRLAAMGGTLASEIIAGAIIGWLLDKLFGTAPVLVIVFTVGGILVGMITFIRNALRESRQAGRNAKQIAEHHHHRDQPPESPGAMSTDPLERLATLPFAALLGAVWAGCAVVGGLWAGVVWVAGRGAHLAVTGVLGATVVGVAATLVLLLLRPWRPKPLSRWPSVWVASSFVRLLITLGGAFLLYSATQYRSRALWLAVVLAYLAVLVGETRVYARSMRRFTPVPGGRRQKKPGPQGQGREEQVHQEQGLRPRSECEMLFSVAATDLDPLGHVLDRNIIGGSHPLVHGTEDLTILGSPLLTMHMVTLVAAALILLWVMHVAARAIATGPESSGNDRYLTRGRLGQLVEVISLYLRDKIVQPVLGSQTNKYLPYLLTLFFFVLMNNLLGLIPLLDLQHLAGWFFGDSHFAFIGGTATGNLAVTGGLALISFLVIQVHGVRELGIGGWLHHLLGGAPAYLAPIMVPVEILSTLIKPFALAIRLFANMLAGHTLMATLALFGLMAVEGTESWIAGFGISIIAGASAVAITFLELFVAFLQAFIFMFLTAVFIGQLSHHHDDGHGERETGGHGAEAAHA